MSSRSAVENGTQNPRAETTKHPCCCSSDLAGKNELEEARSLMLVLTMEDLVTPMFDCYHHIRQDLYPENDESKIVSTKTQGPSVLS